MMNVNVLSLFDGMSCGRIALERSGFNVKNYYASEIKKSAIKCSKHNYPDIVHVGDVHKIHYYNGTLYTETGEIKIDKIDLLIGGSPCQDFSVSNGLPQSNKEKLNLEGNKSKLFFEYLRILNEINPKFFLLENVKMNKKSEVALNEYLGVNGIHINSNLVSYQNRERIYWTNIPNVTLPLDKHISFQDHKDTDWDYCNSFKLNKTPSRIRMWNNGGTRQHVSQCVNITTANKIGCLTRKQDRCPNSGLIQHDDFCRYLTRKELEMAQTVPIGYTNPVSYLQAQDLLGDGWTVDIIAHIFNFIPKEL